MSIRDEIDDRCTEGRLCHLPLTLSYDATVRHMFVHPDLYRLVETGPWETPTVESRFGRLRGNLDEFTRGAKLVVEWNPFEARDAYFGRLDPTTDEVWDIRSRDPKPALRVLGSFAGIDLFIGLEWAWRREFGDRHSRAWRDARERAKTKWRGLFPTYDPHRGEHLHEYLTNAVLA